MLTQHDRSVRCNTTVQYAEQQGASGQFNTKLITSSYKAGAKQRRFCFADGWQYNLKFSTGNGLTTNGSASIATVAVVACSNATITAEVA